MTGDVNVAGFGGTASMTISNSELSRNLFSDASNVTINGGGIGGVVNLGGGSFASKTSKCMAVSV